jgi:hypothetical protein
VDLPDWDAVRDLLLRRPKPPAAATVYAIGKPVAKVVTDGQGAWWIDESTSKVLLTERAALFVEPDRFERIGGGETGAPHTRGWILPAFEPWRYDLQRATGSVLERQTVAGRTSVVADVEGLKGSVTFRLWIDDEAGIILRMERADEPAPLLVLDEIRMGAEPETRPGP